MANNPIAAVGMFFGPVAYAAPALGAGGEVAASALASCVRIPMAPNALGARAGGLELWVATTATNGQTRPFRVYRATALAGGRFDLDLLGTLSGTTGNNTGSADSQTLPLNYRTVDELVWTAAVESSSPAGRFVKLLANYGGRTPDVSNGTGIRSKFFLPDACNADEIVLEPQAGNAGELFGVMARIGH